MEDNGMLSRMGSGVLGLDMSLHSNQHQNHPNSSNPKPLLQHPFQNLQQQQHHHRQMVSPTSYDVDHHNNQSPQPPLKPSVFPYPTKVKQQPGHITLSDEEEGGDDGGGAAADGRKQVSSWQRVKWTDNMIRRLIMVVFYIEDDGAAEVSDALGKKRSGGVLQKKGKWKSVSRAMMEKGFFVSPQQCEDKFNDLNKRYKRVNDIIGKGTACKVVENQSLLDTMDHISPKLKEEVRKLLNSKHLFFKEMCAYHNSGSSCATRGEGGGGSGAVSAHSSHHQQTNQQQLFNSKSVAAKEGSHEEEDGNNEDEDDEDSEEEEEEEEEENHVGASGGHEEEEDDVKSSSKKRPRSSSISMPLQQLGNEVMCLLQDGTKNPYEQRQWMRSRIIQLEEQQVNHQYEAFELEKQRLKWLKFKEDKERDMEKLKLNNERLKLESDRMILLLRKKELELIDLHQRQCSTSKRS